MPLFPCAVPLLMIHARGSPRQGPGDDAGAPGAHRHRTYPRTYPRTLDGSQGTVTVNVTSMSVSAEQDVATEGLLTPS